MHLITKIGLGIIASSALLLIGTALYFRSALPLVDGTVHVIGLSNETRITRDKDGVPHIEAKSLRDATFALGYAHAQDRLWQMEMNRRIGAGRLAEVLGPSAIGKDKFLRTVGFYHAAASTFERLNSETKDLLKSYSSGVNAFLNTHKGALPPEFIILGHEPEKWSVADSLVWMKMMSWDLSKNMWNELERMRLLQTLTPKQVAEFLPPYPGEDPQPLPDYTNIYKMSALDIPKLLAALPEPLPEGAGSNNWVINGERTKSGAPLLANDPHLGLSAPSLWYFAHLKTPSINVIGATLPGVPGIILGRNDQIAWGFTNTGPDVQDLFIEKINPDDAGQYLTPDGWANFETREEIIYVKDGDPVTITVRKTRHGPVISDVLGSNTTHGLNERYVLALAWTSLLEEDITQIVPRR